jgi:prolipoprotein diacylglyceryltransferase
MFIEIDLFFPWVWECQTPDGTFPITSYQLFLGAGILVSYLTTRKLVDSFNLLKSKDIDFFFGIAIAGLFTFAGLFSVIANVFRSKELPPLENINALGGLSSFGGIIGIVLAIKITSWHLKLKLTRKLANAVAVTGTLSMAIGRLGCLTTGCCYGTPAASVGILYTKPFHAPTGVALIPLQLYESLVLFLLSGFLFYLFRRKDEWVWLKMLYLYGLWRFAAEFWRGEQEHIPIFLSGLNLYQMVILLTLTSITVWFLYRKFFTHRIVI